MSTTTLQPLQPNQQPPRAASAQGHRQYWRSASNNSQHQNTRSASHPYPIRHYDSEFRSHSHGSRDPSSPGECDKDRGAERPKEWETQNDAGKDVVVVNRIEAVPSNEDVSHEETARLPESKNVGTSSKILRVTDFELMRTLGTGTFARVWLCRFKHSPPSESHKVYALKVLKKVDVIKLKQVEHVRNERNTLAAVAGHPFITTLVASFSDSISLYMLLEYTPGGEVFSYLRRARRFPFATVQFYAAEITLILAYLHDIQHVAYRDLKPENILLDAEGHLKLVDFGFAKYLPPAMMTNENGEPVHGAGITYTLCGTPEYLAPEVIRNSGHGTAVDWWALGILVYEMLIGQPPFWDQNPMRIYEQIVQGHIRFPVSSSHSHSHQARTHPRRSLHVPRAARDFILQLCQTDPTQRLGHIVGGSKRVMEHCFFDGIDWEDVYYRRKRGPIIPRVEWAGDAGNFDEYPDPIEGEESEGGRGCYTDEMRDEWEEAFADF